MKHALLFIGLVGVAWTQPNEELGTRPLQQAEADLRSIAQEGEPFKRDRKEQDREAQKSFRRNLTRCKSNLKNLATACEMYATDNKGHYPNWPKQLVEKKYLRALPSCPLGGRYQYSVTAKPGSFSWACPCDHSGNNAPKGYPRFTSTQGLQEHP